MSRFKPLDEILLSNVPKRTQGNSLVGYAGNDSKVLINNHIAGHVPSVPNVPKIKIIDSVRKSAGEAVTTKDVSREKWHISPSHADCGMIKCSMCGYWANRCRHPTLHNGIWLDKNSERWRRCRGYIATK